MAGTFVRNAIALILLGLAVTAAAAQDTLLSDLYGQGVHAYFSGDYEKAHRLLTMAIDQGSRDPRCYYFRGLSYEQLGRPDEGTNDFKQGAELEAAGEGAQVDIGASLQRVQGQKRLELEKVRYQARLQAHVSGVKQRQQRYERFQRDEERVIRKPGAGQDVTIPEAPPADSADPFAGGAEAIPSVPGGAAPPAPAEMETVAPPAPADTSDPFADPAEPVVVPPAGTEPPAPAADPFGAPAAPAADPFGGLTMPAPADTGATPAADPFGAPAAPAAPADGGAAPAADPFGAPAVPADGGASPAADPFGAPAAPTVPADGGAAPAADPFGAPTVPADGGAAPAADPFGAPAAPADAGAAPAADPFGAPAAPADGGAAPAADPFGTPAAPAAPADGGAAPAADPFGAPAAPADAGAAPAMDPFGAPAAPADGGAAPAADPFGTPAAAAGAAPATPEQPTTPPAEPGTERVQAKVGVGVKGRSLDEHEGLLVTPAKAYFSARERIVFEIAVPKALQLYEATNGSPPRSHEEFMTQVIEAQGIKLPELPPGQRYVYDPQTKELMVERPAR